MIWLVRYLNTALAVALIILLLGVYIWGVECGYECRDLGGSTAVV